MVTMQDLFVAKHCNKRNSKNEMLHVHHTLVDEYIAHITMEPDFWYGYHCNRQQTN